jgi:hypothetical protein
MLAQTRADMLASINGYTDDRYFEANEIDTPSVIHGIPHFEGLGHATSTGRLFSSWPSFEAGTSSYEIALAVEILPDVFTARKLDIRNATISPHVSDEEICNMLNQARLRRAS